VSTWAAEAIGVAQTLGLTKPVAQQTFTGSITREQFAAVAVELYALLTGETIKPATQNPFKDTSNQAVLNAYQLGIVSGTGQDSFSPSSQITREQLAVMLLRVLDKSGVKLEAGAKKTFSDQKQFSAYAVNAIQFMSSIGVVQGYTSTTFAPKQNASIEQAVIMAKRLYEVVQDGGVKLETKEPKPSPGTEQNNNDFALEVYIKSTNPQPDGEVFNEYGIRNTKDFTLAPYSAVYITAGSSDRIPFEEEYQNYTYGGTLLVANTKGVPVTFKAGELVAGISHVYADVMGTVREADGTTYQLKQTGPYARIIKYDGKFDDSEPYKTYIEQKRVLELGDWVKLNKAVK